MLKDRYDVIVVGCGPAGSSTARECAERGLSVLALERNLEVGTPVRCGEGLSENTVQSLDLDVPDRCIAQKVSGGAVYAPNGKRIDLKYEGTEGYILERKAFDKWLGEEASNVGARIVTHSKVTDVLQEGERVTGVKASIMGEKKKIRSKIVIAADGVESLIMRKAGLKTNKNPMYVDSGYQYEMSNIDLEEPETISLYFGQKKAPRGYCWIFPKGETRANVGIGIGAVHGGRKTAKYYLDRFVHKKKALKKGSILEVNGGAIPVGGFMKDMVGDGILGIGDSVNQVNPIHGGGISESMKASKIAGEVIAKAFEQGDFSKEALQPYNERWWKEHGERLQKVEKVRELFEKMSDEEMNDMAQVLDGEDLTDLAHGRKYGKLAKLYMKFKAKGVERKVKEKFGSD